MKKVKGILIVIAIAVAIFGILLAVEKNTVSKYERVAMAVAVKEIPRALLPFDIQLMHRRWMGRALSP